MFYLSCVIEYRIGCRYLAGVNATLAKKSEASGKLGLGPEPSFVDDVWPRSVKGEAARLAGSKPNLPEYRADMIGVPSIDPERRKEIVQSNLQTDNLRMRGADTRCAPQAARGLDIDQ